MSAANRSAASVQRSSDCGAYSTMSKNRGLHLGLAPVLLVPTDRGPMGGGLSVDGRYGIKAGPTVIAPG